MTTKVLPPSKIKTNIELCSKKPTLIDQNNIKVKQSNNEYQKSQLKLNKTKCDIKNFGDERFKISTRGYMKQYCVKGSEVVLRPIHYIRNDKSKMLMITVDNKKHQVDTYYILTAKNVCPFNFQDNTAFVIKTIDSNNHLKSMTLKPKTIDEKIDWIHTYGIKINHATKILNSCIEEIERRRFHMGVKKRYEERHSSKVSIDILVEILESVKENTFNDFSNETEWSITNLEKLIQTILNELTEPLIPYNLQKCIRKSEKFPLNIINESKKLLASLPNCNKTIFVSLLAHMERLSKYYLIVMSSPRKDLPHIRLNICQRLTPIIFRLQESRDTDIVLNRACDLLYQTLIRVNELNDI